MVELLKVYPKWLDNRQRKRKFNDLSGQQFGRLTVLYRSTDEVMSNGNKTPRYACKCKCGNYVLARATNLKRGHTSSCKACNRSESNIGKNLEDLTGQRFHRWTVLERAESILEPRGRYATVWTCRCDCGTVRDVRASALKGNLTYSCGCTTEPSLEAFTREYLQEADIVFDRHKTFEGLRGVGNGLLSYDFALYDDHSNVVCLIECQGKQHFAPFEFFGGVPQFEVQQEHDRRKREHAKRLNIPLLEIDYRMTTYDDVANKLDEFLKTIILAEDTNVIV